MSYGKKLYKSNLTAFDAENVYDSTIGKLQNEINADQIVSMNDKVSKSGDTMTGRLVLISATGGTREVLHIKDHAMEIGTDPSVNTYDSIIFKDNNDVTAGFVRQAYMNDGRRMLQFSATSKNGSATNSFDLGFDTNGDPMLGVPSADKAAWCKGIGALDIGNVGTPLASGTNVDTDLNDGEAYYSGSTNVTSGLNGTKPMSQGFKIVQVRSYSSTNYKSQIAFTSSDATPIKIRHYVDANNDGTNTGWSPWWAPVRDIDLSLETTGVLSSILTLGTNIQLATTSSISFSSWGHIASIVVGFKASDSIASGATIATLVSSKRPLKNNWIIDSSGGSVEVRANGAIVVQHAMAKNAVVYIETSYMLV